MAASGAQLTQRPLYVFDLPEELLATIVFKDSHRSHIETASVKDSRDGTLQESDHAAPQPSDDAPSKGPSCALCRAHFAIVQEQREHIKSDFHAFNLKQKLKGLTPVDEADFERLVGDLAESISGSESSGSSDDTDNENGKQHLADLLRRQAKITAEPPLSQSPRPPKAPGNPPIYWFSSSALPENTSIGIYRSLFSPTEQADASKMPEVLRRKQLAPNKAQHSGSLKQKSNGVQLPTDFNGPHYFLCMIGGGHFAAMVVELAPKEGKKHNGATERSATVLAHKTFHRYTTRRKQGGAQSANDSAKGNAHSAGASIRRANEAALITEIRDLLKQWQPMIDAAELIFVRASGKQNRSTVFGPYDGQVLRANDPRNRSFPFNTRRPTQAELMRCFVELTRAKVSQIDEAALAAAEAAAAEEAKQKQLAQAPAVKPIPMKPKHTKEEEAAALHTNQVVALIKRSRIPALLSYLSSNSLTATFRFHSLESDQQYHHNATPLHLAASSNSPIVVEALLQRAGADPAVLNGDGKPAFELAGDRATRDAFRVARHELGEAKWDWPASGVGAALSREEAGKRAEAERGEKDAAAVREAERRRRETERLRAETERQERERIEQRIGVGRSLRAAVPEKTAAEKREEDTRGMTPEMRQRLERERRARAAEARIARMQGGGG